MSRHLAIRLHNGGSITAGTALPEDAVPFDGLGELLDMEVSEAGADPPDVELVPPGAMPECRHTISSTPLTETAYDADWRRILLAGWKKKPRRPHFYCCNIWQAALNLATMNAVLRGENAVLAHCAVLEADRGAVLLFGESGMGKSTAFMRWRANGGRGFSDDMALLDFSGTDGVVRVRRMPTWSLCREGRNEWNYPAGEELPMIGFFPMGRSETGHDEIEDLSAARYFAQCYRSMFYWALPFARRLPDRMKAILTAHIREKAETMTAMQSPRVLLAALEGNLKKLIEDSL
jgi:hypothetical protein